MAKKKKEFEQLNYFVDEAGDGVLFGRKGRLRLQDEDACKFFMLGMVSCDEPEKLARKLSDLRSQLMANPLYASIYSMQPEARKTARAFHAKDDHSEVRARVFEFLMGEDFKFFAVIKDMRAVLREVGTRNLRDPKYRYHPNELYDQTVAMLFKQRLHKHEQISVCIARRGKSDRTRALMRQLEEPRRLFMYQIQKVGICELQIQPAYPWEEPCLQIADYCLWALQRCYEKHEDRFLRALWPKVSLVWDRDDPVKGYGSYLRRTTPIPDPEKIKNRWV